MAWETRNGKGRYFTVTRRRKRYYLGPAGSLPAELAAVAIALRYVEGEELRRITRPVPAAVPYEPHLAAGVAAFAAMVAPPAVPGDAGAVAGLADTRVPTAESTTPARARPR
jgi:hypothetical protein